MDEFAQSREDDDLFADEFEPVAEPIIVEPPPPSTRGNHNGPPASARTNTNTNIAITSNKTPPGPRNGRGGSRGGREEGRGGRGGNRGGGGLGSSRYAQPEDVKKSDVSSNDTPAGIPKDAPTVIEPLATATDSQSTTNGPPTALEPVESAATDDSTPSVEAAPSSQPQTPARPTAVRGDRTLTGGPAHKKLTEAELSEKMEKMKILNAQKVERFRLSEEDSAAYARKEKEMAKKRVEEQKNARAMDMERAKNRQRKLAAQGGREWDEGKLESDIVDGKGRGRSSEYVRGGHGGVIRGGLAGSRFASDGVEPEEGGQTSGKGRGGFEIRGRGNRGGRGGGKGGKSAVTVPTKEDFPELPTKKAATIETLKSPLDKPAGDWAEEMATPIEEKKIESSVVQP